LRKLDACVKSGVLVDLVCLKTTLKECVRRFSEVPASQWLQQAGIGHANMTVWKVLLKRLCFKPYEMQLVQALTPADKVNGVNFASRCS
jgi:hypothetical protein